MPGERRHKGTQPGRLGHLRVCAGGRVLPSRQQQAGRRVVAFAHELFAQNLVPLGAGRPNELREDGEMRGSRSDGGAGRFAILQNHQPSDERLVGGAVCGLAMRQPKVCRRPDGLLGPIVEVVAEARADVALELDRGDQPPVVDHQHVPELRGPEISGKGDEAALPVYLGGLETVRPDHRLDDFEEAVQILAGGDSRALPLVGPAILGLLLAGAFPIAPKSFYGLPCKAFVIREIQRHRLRPFDATACAPPRSDHICHRRRSEPSPRLRPRPPPEGHRAS